MIVPHWLRGLIFGLVLWLLITMTHINPVAGLITICVFGTIVGANAKWLKEN